MSVAAEFGAEVVYGDEEDVGLGWGGMGGRDEKDNHRESAGDRHFHSCFRPELSEVRFLVDRLYLVYGLAFFVFSRRAKYVFYPSEKEQKRTNSEGKVDVERGYDCDYE